MRKEIPDHLSWKCKHRETTCEFCMTKMPLTDLQVTYDITADISHDMTITWGLVAEIWGVVADI